MKIDDAALDFWKHDQLTKAEERLVAAIPTSQNSLYNVLAVLALVRARLGKSDEAITNAKKVLTFRSSFVHPNSDTDLHQVHPTSAIRHRLHCKECSPDRQGEEE